MWSVCWVGVCIIISAAALVKSRRGHWCENLNWINECIYCEVMDDGKIEYHDLNMLTQWTNSFIYFLQTLLKLKFTINVGNSQKVWGVFLFFCFLMLYWDETSCVSVFTIEEVDWGQCRAVSRWEEWWGRRLQPSLILLLVKCSWVAGLVACALHSVQGVAHGEIGGITSFRGVECTR